MVFFPEAEASGFLLPQLCNYVNMRIRRLELYTAQLDRQKQFYHVRLGLPLLAEDASSFNLAIGSSQLNFIQKNHVTPYHFAFNIPSNQHQDALAWLKQRVDIQGDNSQEIIDYPNWNAKAIYFYDEDRNIVELIARKNLQVENKDPFNHHALLSLSEIGLAVNDIETTYQCLQGFTQIPVYDGNFERFCAAGDENGLFIVINKNKKAWYPTNDQALTSDFKIDFEQNHQAVSFSFQHGEIHRSSNV